MLFYFSIKEKISKENRKKNESERNGLTYENKNSQYLLGIRMHWYFIFNDQSYLLWTEDQSTKDIIY